MIEIKKDKEKQINKDLLYIHNDYDSSYSITSSSDDKSGNTEN